MRLKTRLALERVGDSGRYQLFVVIFVALKWWVVSLTVFVPSYLFMAPSSSCESNSGKETCTQECRATTTDTLTSQMGLYCQRAVLRDFLLSSQFVGSIVGLVVLAVLADTLGRRFIVVTTLGLTLMGSVLLALGGLTSSVAVAMCAQCLLGFGGYALSMVSCSYLSEINSEKWRQRSMILTYTFWAMGQITVFFIVQYLRNWLLTCVFVFSLPLLCLLVASFFIVETPEFLWLQGRSVDALYALNRIASFNGHPPLDSTQLDRLVSLQELQPPSDDEQINEKHPDQQSPLNQKSPSLNLVEEKWQSTNLCVNLCRKEVCVSLLVLSVAQACNNGYYYTAQFSLDQYGFGFARNMLMVGCVELTACLLTNWFCERLLRKLTIIFTMTLCGICGIFIGCLRLLPLSLTTLKILELFLLAISRFMNTADFSIFGLLCSESFATEVRSTGMGITEAASNLGNIIAPFLVLLAQRLSMKPVLIGGILNLCGVFAMLFARQTKKEKKQSNTN